MANVMTVQGPIENSQMGITMPHVHLLSGLFGFDSPQEANRQFLSKQSISMEMLGTVRRNYTMVRDMLSLSDVELAVEELMHYKRLGGSTVAECSVQNIGRDPIGLKKISGATGVHIICSTGSHVDMRQDEKTRSSTVEQLQSVMSHELMVGIGTTGVRAGFIKVACSSKNESLAYTGNEENILRAAARVQKQTGVALTIHPAHNYGRSRPYDVYLQLLKQEKVDMNRVYLSHADFWSSQIEYLEAIASQGITLSFDQYGNEFYAAPGIAYEADRNRTNAICHLLKKGYVSQIVLSNEVAWKARLCKYGGNGYGYLLEYVLQDFRYFGVTEEQIHQMLVVNPSRLFLHSL